MRGKGFSDERPWAAAEGLSGAYESGQITPQVLRTQELATSTADASCYQDTGQSRLKLDVQSRIEEQIKVDDGSTLSVEGKF